MGRSRSGPFLRSTHAPSVEIGGGLFKALDQLLGRGGLVRVVRENRLQDDVGVSP